MSLFFDSVLSSLPIHNTNSFNFTMKIAVILATLVAGASAFGMLLLLVSCSQK